MKYRKVLIQYNVYLGKLYFTCENIKSCIKYNFFMGEIGCPLLPPLSSLSQLQISIQLYISYKWVKAQRVDIHFL